MSAGAQTAAFVKEDSFDSRPGSPTYYRPGREIGINDLQLDNNPQRLHEEDEPEPVDTIAGNFVGTLGLTYVMSNDVHGDVRDIVFNDSGTGFTTGLAPTSTWYLSTDYLNTSFGQDTVELELRACIPRSYAITYEQGTNTIREDLQLGVGDWRKNTATTPSSVTGPTSGSDAPFHGVDLTIDGSTVNRDQSITLSFPEPLYRYHRESDRTPAAAVEAGPEPELTSRVIYHTDDYLGLALGGGTGSTSVGATLSDVSGSLAFTSEGGATIATYSFTDLAAQNWQAQNFMARGDADFEGTVNWSVDGGISIA